MISNTFFSSTISCQSDFCISSLNQSFRASMDWRLICNTQDKPIRNTHVCINNGSFWCAGCNFWRKGTSLHSGEAPSNPSFATDLLHSSSHLLPVLSPHIPYLVFRHRSSTDYLVVRQEPVTRQDLSPPPGPTAPAPPPSPCHRPCISSGKLLWLFVPHLWGQAPSTWVAGGILQHGN